MAEELDEVEELEILWALGDEGPHVYGRAAIEHWPACIRGEVPTSRGGRATTIPAFEHTDVSHSRATWAASGSTRSGTRSRSRFRAASPRRG